MIDSIKRNIFGFCVFNKYRKNKIAMCLIANRYNPFLITLHKRKVYKVLLKDKLKNGELCTPFRFAEVNMNDKTMKASGRIEISHYETKSKCIEGGMIHSFTDESSASNCAMLLRDSYKCWNLSNYFVVYEAIIPPFTLYIKGKDCEIASRKLKFVKEVYKI